MGPAFPAGQCRQPSLPASGRTTGAVTDGRLTSVGTQCDVDTSQIQPCTSASRVGSVEQVDVVDLIDESVVGSSPSSACSQRVSSSTPQGPVFPSGASLGRCLGTL